MATAHAHHPPKLEYQPALPLSRGKLFMWLFLSTEIMFFAALIGKQFFPTDNPTTSLLASFGVFAVGFIGRPLGALLFGARAVAQGTAFTYQGSLADGGAPSQCGWLKDRFGLSWQVIPKALMSYLEGPDPAGSERAMQEMLTQSKLDIEAIPDDDPATFATIRASDTIGCFQIESPGQRELLQKLQPDRFEDLIVDISLFRPGPMSPRLSPSHGSSPWEQSRTTTSLPWWPRDACWSATMARPTASTRLPASVSGRPKSKIS